MSKPVPKRTDLNYLIGWFKIEIGSNNARLAKQMAEEYLRVQQE